MTTQATILIPNLVIGGAPKCGTSSLFSWLNDHPEVCGSSPKESFFLMDKNNPMINPKYNIHQDGLAGYHHFFSNKLQENCKILCEATTHYLYQKTALEVLASLDPKPNIIFLLRNPSNRIYSSFEYTKNNRAKFKKNLSFFDFAQILLQGNTDALDAYIDEEQSLYVLKKDLLYSTYIFYLEQWKNKLGLPHIHIFLFEELISSPLKVINKVTDILEINSTFYNTYVFSKKNETYFIQKHGLHKVLKKYTPVLPNGSIKNRLKNVYLKVVSGTKENNKSDIDGLKLLNEYFRPYNHKLSSAFNLDISVWDK